MLKYNSKYSAFNVFKIQDLNVFLEKYFKYQVQNTNSKVKTTFHSEPRIIQQFFKIIVRPL